MMGHREESRGRDKTRGRDEKEEEGAEMKGCREVELSAVCGGGRGAASGGQGGRGAAGGG